MARGESQRTVEILPRIVEEAGPLALVGIEEHGVKVRLSYARDADQVVVDRIQVPPVRLNLIRNAIEAMANSARRELVVATARRGDGALVTVAKTGPRGGGGNAKQGAS